MSIPAGAARFYRDRRALHDAARAAAGRRSRIVSYLRVAAFGVAFAALIAAVNRAVVPPAAAWSAGVAGLLVFAVLVFLHARIDRRERWLEALSRVNADAEARVRRDWAALPVPEAAAPTAFAADLDLFGRASVLQWLGPSTAPGAATLAAWLVAPARPDAIRARHQAIVELAELQEFRERLAAHGRLAAGVTQADVDRFVAWAESPPWLVNRPVILWLVRVSAAASLLLIAAHAIGALTWPAWVLPLAVNVALMALFQVNVHELLERASGPERAMRHYTAAFALVARTPFRADALRRIASRLEAGAVPAHAALAALDRLHGWANLRLSAAVFHLPIQVVSLWDFHVLAAIERWQGRQGSGVRQWLDALAEMDALASMAGVRHDHPGWALPEAVEAGIPLLAASALGHPLIPDDARVTNDVEVGPPGTVLFVTGSNMSGKSTLLRAIGVNVVLAQAGSPVCASSLRLSPVVLETSMRVQDSLEAGVSFFMAALRRLKEVVDAARRLEHDRGRTLLFLLDEILQGTNTAERQVASRRIVASLIRLGAIGAVTSHDLALMDAPGLSEAARAVHFSERVHGPGEAEGLSFDYRLRPGVAASTNALLLMRIVGLGVEDEDPAAGRVRDH